MTVQRITRINEFNTTKLRLDPPRLLLNEFSTSNAN